MSITDVTNPGTVDPSRQGFPPAGGSSSSPSSAPLVSSTGETQLPALQTTPPQSTLGHGLAADVRPENNSCARPQSAQVAQSLPPSVNVRGGDAHPGGLPKNVRIL